MDPHLKKVYVPMTETAFFILFCLREPNHGYGVVQTVERLTEGAVRLAPGTMYGSLSKMEKDGLIRRVSKVGIFSMKQHSRPRQKRITLLMPGEHEPLFAAVIA